MFVQVINKMSRVHKNKQPPKPRAEHSGRYRGYTFVNNLPSSESPESGIEQKQLPVCFSSSPSLVTGSGITCPSAEPPSSAGLAELAMRPSPGIHNNMK